MITNSVYLILYFSKIFYCFNFLIMIIMLSTNNLLLHAINSDYLIDVRKKSLPRKKITYIWPVRRAKPVKKSDII